MLSDEHYLEVVERAPLVSIDIIAVDSSGRALVGERRNSPAKRRWFVPGGSVKKNETLDEAFERITGAELGRRWSRGSAQFIGVFDHFYDTNFKEAPNIGTRYVALAYLLEVHDDLSSVELPDGQHSRYAWVSQTGVTPDGHALDIHENTRVYLAWVAQPLTGEQYQIANARRDSFNSLLWQTPALTLAGLAFLFTILLSTPSIEARFVAATLAMLVSLAALQLMGKHRFYERRLAILLERDEARRGELPLNARAVPGQHWLKESSFDIWRALFVLFFAAAVVSFLLLTF